MTGHFISFEGGEGSGKTTQIKMLARSFNKAGIECITTREPGGVAGAETIRSLLLENTAQEWDPVAETLLFYAARKQHVEELIKPALAKNKIVISDRFADSTLVYQGIGKKLGVEIVQSVHRLVLGSFEPHITLLLDIDPAVGLARAAKRKTTETRFEQLGIEFHAGIRQGFLDLARNIPRFCVIDAAHDVSKVHARIIAHINAQLNLSLPMAES